MMVNLRNLAEEKFSVAGILGKPDNGHSECI
jgi:hypothetical protein